jgi:hypothetical protein
MRQQGEMRHVRRDTRKKRVTETDKTEEGKLQEMGEIGETDDGHPYYKRENRIPRIETEKGG